MFTETSVCRLYHDSYGRGECFHRSADWCRSQSRATGGGVWGGRNNSHRGDDHNTHLGPGQKHVGSLHYRGGSRPL